MANPATRTFNIFALICLVSGCSGGGVGGDDAPNIIDRSGRSSGAITGFSSVIVNGVTFDTNGATITSDDQPAQLSDLSVGQQVVVLGEIFADGSTGRADRVISDPSIAGTVSSVDPALNQLTILGNQVQITADTRFRGITPPDLSAVRVGNQVEAWGVRGENGRIVATLIGATTAQEFELLGQVSALNPSANSFAIDGLSVDYSSASFVGFSNDIADGDLVEVEGNTLSGSTLIAQRIELESDRLLSSAPAGSEFEVEGIVTSVTSATRFDIGTTTVVTDASTRYEGGSSTDVTAGVRLEAEGTVTADALLQASEIEFRLESNLEIEAVVEAVDAQSVTLLGTAFSVSTTTNLIDESDAQLQNFALSDLEIGDFAKIKASTSGTEAVATLIKRKSPEDKLKIEGPVSQVNAPDIQIVNSVIATSSGTEFEINDANATNVEFFDQLSVGDIVSAEGQSSQPGILEAEKVELED